MNEIQNKTGTNAVIFIIVLFLVLLCISAIIRIKEREVDNTLIELYDPIEPQEIRDFRNQIK